MYLFLDTETSSLPDFKLPPDHPAQPHIVSLAAWLGDWWGEINEMRHVASVNVVLKPHGYHFDPRAIAVHKITEEYAHAFGEEAETALSKFHLLVTQAADTDAPLLIAHNFTFDHRMLLREFAHVGMDHTLLGQLRPFCTMKALTPRMKLPRPGGSRFPGTDSYKWPKLDEAYAFMFDGAPVPGREDKHDAMADCLACKDIYVEGKVREWWP
jgi:DNA polymerase-3 subunit epsilon